MDSSAPLLDFILYILFIHVSLTDLFLIVRRPKTPSLNLSVFSASPRSLTSLSSDGLGVAFGTWHVLNFKSEALLTALGEIDAED